MRTHRLAVVVVAVFLGLFVAQNAHAQVLTKSGSCPGTMTFQVTGAAPFARLGFLHAANTGSWTIPSGVVCGTTVTGLAAPISFGGWVTANAFGNRTITINVGAGLCGRWLQVLDSSNCTLTNVIQLN